MNEEETKAIAALLMAIEHYRRPYLRPVAEGDTDLSIDACKALAVRLTQVLDIAIDNVRDLIQ